MVNQEPDDDITGNSAAPTTTPAPLTAATALTALTAAGASRRSFGKLGMGAGGVILTLASQPGMASVVCASPSQSLSKWKSTHVGATLACSGVSPGYWVQSFHSWPSGLQQQRTTLKFGAMFACGVRTDYANILVQTLLSPQKFDTNNIGRHFAATYLNIQAGRISFLTIASLQAIWGEWLRTGTYKPTAGVVWDASRIVIYLQSTMS